MKHTSCLVLSMLLISASCSKKESGETDTKICPVISSSAVPVVVIDSFTVRCPSDTVLTWFRKDSVGYCAYFIDMVAQKTLAEFSNSGNFIKQEIDINQDGNFEDSTNSQTKGASGCECEIPEND